MRWTILMLSIAALSGCAGEPKTRTVPVVETSEVRPPESLVRIVPRPEAPVLPPRPAPPHPAHQRREAALFNWALDLDAALGVYEANTRGLRRLYHFDADKPPAPPAVPPAAQPPSPPNPTRAR